jgi:hypothetical protein
VVDYVPRGGWVGELCVVYDAHLFILQIHINSFATGWWREMAGHREAFHRLGVQDITEYNSD